MLRDVQAERIDFAFLYWPELDGLLHRVGNQSPEVPPKLRSYEAGIHRLLQVAQEHYAEVRLYVFSDHGMANCDALLDLKARIEPLPLAHGPGLRRRLRFHHGAVLVLQRARARNDVTAALNQVPQGRILDEAELKRLRACFADRYFGELIFLVNEGVLIVPSHMGERPIRAMHGYHPAEKHSYAMLCTNQSEIPDDITAIPDIFRLMTRDAELAHERNREPLAEAIPNLS